MTAHQRHAEPQHDWLARTSRLPTLHLYRSFRWSGLSPWAALRLVVEIRRFKTGPRP